MADVAVVGLGALGAATVRALARDGARVTGIDPRPAGHDEGSSHGDSRIVRRALFEHPDYVAIVDRALELWRELQAGTPRRVLHDRVGLLLGGAAGGPLVTGTLEAARRHELAIERVAAREAPWPAFRLDAGMELLHDPDGGILRPEEAVRAQLEDAARRGAELVHGTRALSWQPAAGGGLRLRTDSGERLVSRLVLAPGPWAPELLGAVGSGLSLLRKSMRWHLPAESGVWDAESTPVFAFEHGGSLLYGFPPLDGRGVKIADHGGGLPVESPESPAPEGEEDLRIEALRERFLRGLEPRASARASCLYTMTADEHPLLGAHPEHDSVFIAAGFSGHGFKHSIAFGEALAALVGGRRARLPLSLFAPDRFNRSQGPPGP